ncbi:hypothetical protein OAO01_09745, partial [Oligoflexia bacterium]|nr:hypothetical protein [Oligoflexia bacterium]
LGKMKAALTAASKSSGGTSRVVAPNPAVKQVTVPQQVDDSEPKAAPVREQGTSPEPHWAAFVSSIDETVYPMLIEHLRRLSVDRFKSGTLDARGPEFSVKYLSSSDNLACLKELLGNYDGSKRWNVQLVKGGNKGQPEAGSLSDIEQRKKKERAKNRKQELSEHPKMQTIKKNFPGSTIENITLKE